MRKYNYIYILLMFIFLNINKVFSQEIKGVILDLENSKRVSTVKITNLRTHQEVKSDPEGNFIIPGQVNDYLAFEVRGYDRDTAFIYQEGLRYIYLIRDKSTIQIDEVVVTKITDSRLSREIERAKNNSESVETSQQKGGLRVSPSRLFGQSAKQARNAIKILELEQETRFVDRVFTDKKILSLIPLNSSELALFKSKYRPSYSFVKQSQPEDITSHILVSYAEFKELNKK